MKSVIKVSLHYEIKCNGTFRDSIFQLYSYYNLPYVRTYVRMYVCMYVCMHARVCVCITSEFP